MDEAAFIPSDPSELLAGADLAAPSLVSSRTAAPWFRQTAVSTDGVDALRTGSTPDDGESFITAIADGPAMIGFQWKTSSDHFDRLRFWNDNSVEFNFGGVNDWQTHLSRTGSGLHLLKWQYLKNFITTAGDDAAWLDRIDVATAGPLAPSLEGAGLTFATGGNAPWAGYGMTSYSHDGVDLAGSGQIGVGQTSWLETSVTGPGTFTFWWRTAVAFTADATVSVDGKTWLDGGAGGALDGWAPVTIALNAGNHIIRWTHTKSLTNVSSFDGIWVDEAAWTAQASPPLFAAFDLPVSPVIAAGGGSWFSQTAVALNAGGALETGPLNDGDTTELHAEFAGPGNVVFQHNNPGLSAYLTVDDGISVPLADSEGFWLPAGYPIGGGVHRLKWTVDLVSGLSADPDGDGLPNGVEALIGTDPHSGNGDIFNSALLESPPPPQWAITFSVSNTAPADFVPGIETSTDLSPGWRYVAGALAGVWSAIPPATVTTAPGAAGFTDVTVNVPSDGSRLFARLVVVRGGGEAGNGTGGGTGGVGTGNGNGWGSGAAGGGPGADGSANAPGGGGGGGDGDGDGDG